MLALQRTIGNRAVQRLIVPKLAVSRRGSTAEHAADRNARADPVPGPRPGVGIFLQRYASGEHTKFGGTGTASTQQKVKVQGKDGSVTMAYGQMMAMADLMKGYDSLKDLTVAQINQLVSLVDREANGGKVSTTEWDRATGGKYVDLARQNTPHFGPSDTRVAASTGGHGGDFKSEWIKYHFQAMGLAAKGKLDEAMAVNAFGDHFLTDAFASGHLVNKEDVMTLFRGKLQSSKGAFKRVAEEAWKDSSVSSKLSKYETVEYKGIFFRPNINSASRLASLLEAIYQQKPDVVEGMVAGIVHDVINRKGVEVENAKGERWHLSGDNTLNAKSLAMGQQAVEQSRNNLRAAASQMGMLNADQAVRAVWDYTPKPTTDGAKSMKEAVDKWTDPNDQAVIDQMADWLKGNIDLLIQKLVEEKALKLAMAEEPGGEVGPGLSRPESATALA